MPANFRGWKVEEGDSHEKTAIITGSSRGNRLCHRPPPGSGTATTWSCRLRRIRRKPAGPGMAHGSGTEWVYVQADIGDHDDRLGIVREAVKAFGRIDVLVNNAGVAPLERVDLLEMTEESFDRVIGINTRGNMFLTQAVARQMIAQPMQGRKRGTIINISSCSAEVSSISRGEYCVSKAGVSMLTTLYADRLACEGILVNEVRPGVIATDMTSTVQAKYDKLFADGVFPIARWGQPEDVADAVSALRGGRFPVYHRGLYRRGRRLPHPAPVRGGTGE